jgi:hypothetical protein
MDEVEASRLRFLCEVIAREADYLEQTDGRLFTARFDAASAAALREQPERAERVDAFVARLSRLQDNTAEKLLPRVLDLLLEPSGAVLDNLDRAERRGWLASADAWAVLRRLRNRLIHEYVQDSAALAEALNAAHDAVPWLVAAARRLVAEAQVRLAMRSS